jgi:hypothetical protein
METIETRYPKVWAYYLNDGAYKCARAVVNELLIRRCGIGLSDLPDTSELACVVEEIAEALESNDCGMFKEACQQFTTEFIEELIYH